MNKLNYLLIAMFFASLSVVAQKKKDVLLTLDGKPVYVKEFKQVYSKNLDLVQDEEQKTVPGYLKMFVDYKLKVAEAYTQKFHEKESYEREFAKYEEQLSRNYIFENKVTEDLAKEAYDRSLEEIHASHILIMSSYNDVPQDTLVAYNKALEAQRRARAGEDFDALIKEFSEEPGLDKSNGNLGYFTAFSMVYPFETMAYKTKKGAISDIARTRFGYHVINVKDRRIKEGDISVSHIMITTQKGKIVGKPSERIEEIKALLEQGESFESLAKQYSDDKNSAKNGGKIKRFSKGQLRSKAFEDGAFGLKKPGDVSDVVKSEFGLHLIRLDEVFPLASYEEKKEELEKRVKEGSRSKIVTSAVNQKIKERYGFEKKNGYAPFMYSFIPDTVMTSSWKDRGPVPEADNKVLFVIGDWNVDYNDFAAFIDKGQQLRKREKSKNDMIDRKFGEFETYALKKYFRDQLEDENEEYASVISEYRDGLLIFEVMGKNVWRKAKNDSLGQREFFSKNRSDYQWKDRVVVEMISTSKKEIAEKAKELLHKGGNGKAVKEELNKAKVNLILTERTYEVDNQKLPVNFKPVTGVSEIYESNDNFVIVNVTELIPAGPKEFEDIKGKVLSDYQNYVEEQWMVQLRAKYPLEVNEKALKKLTRQFN